MAKVCPPSRELFVTTAYGHRCENLHSQEQHWRLACPVSLHFALTLKSIGYIRVERSQMHNLCLNTFLNCVGSTKQANCASGSLCMPIAWLGSTQSTSHSCKNIAASLPKHVHCPHQESLSEQTSNHLACCAAGLAFPSFSPLGQVLISSAKLTAMQWKCHVWSKLWCSMSSTVQTISYPGSIHTLHLRAVADYENEETWT